MPDSDDEVTEEEAMVRQEKSERIRKMLAAQRFVEMSGSTYTNIGFNRNTLLYRCQYIIRVKKTFQLGIYVYLKVLGIAITYIDYTY